MPSWLGVNYVQVCKSFSSVIIKLIFMLTGAGSWFALIRDHWTQYGFGDDRNWLCLLVSFDLEGLVRHFS